MLSEWKRAKRKRVVIPSATTWQRSHNTAATWTLGQPACPAPFPRPPARRNPLPGMAEKLINKEKNAQQAPIRRSVRAGCSQHACLCLCEYVLERGREDFDIENARKCNPGSCSHTEPAPAARLPSADLLTHRSDAANQHWALGVTRVFMCTYKQIFTSKTAFTGATGGETL